MSTLGCIFNQHLAPLVADVALKSTHARGF